MNAMAEIAKCSKRAHFNNDTHNELQVDMIIMNFSKAFDTVPHNRLLNKEQM